MDDLNPKTFVIKKDNQYLFYFGARHTNNPEDRQFSDIKIFWNKFIKDTKKINCIVLLEGNIGRLLDNEKEAIEKAGENGLTHFLASKENLEVFCPEPDKYLESNELLKKYSKDEIVYLYVARYIYQWNRLHSHEDFEKNINSYIEKSVKAVNWDNYDFSLENIKKIHKTIFQKEFNHKDIKFFESIISPVKGGTIINQVSKSTASIRDNYIINKITEFWKDGKNIFVMYGKGHILKQEPILKRELK